MVRPPGFGPGFSPWQGDVLDQDAQIATGMLPFSRLRPHNEALIIKALLNLKNDGKAETTLYSVNQKLTQLGKNTDLNNPEEVKTYIANVKIANASKTKFVQAYDYLVKANELTWTKPKYKWTQKTPIIPTKDQITRIIASCTRRYKTLFTIMAETGISPSELHGLTRKDLDMEQGVIRVTGRKGHDSGNYKLETQTHEMLKD